MGCCSSIPPLPVAPYSAHNNAVILSCYYNPSNSKHRLRTFEQFLPTIANLNYYIIELAVGNQPFQLQHHYKSESNQYFGGIRTNSVLFHKESLLNNLLKKLPSTFEYVFWIDADIMFTNSSWLTESVALLRSQYHIVQPFEYCIHLEKNQVSPAGDVNQMKRQCTDAINPRNKRRCWKSFAAIYRNDPKVEITDYDIHGHVGFAWGARRSLLDSVGGFYDKALIGGADHIMAHACVGQIPHPCIDKVHEDNPTLLAEIQAWSHQFHQVMEGKLGYVAGDVYHLWHGELDKRDYYNRIKKFSKLQDRVTERDENGLFITSDGETQTFMQNYFDSRDNDTGGSGTGVYDDGCDHHHKHGSGHHHHNGNDNCGDHHGSHGGHGGHDHNSGSGGNDHFYY